MAPVPQPDRAPVIAGEEHRQAPITAPGDVVRTIANDGAARRAMGRR